MLYFQNRIALLSLKILKISRNFDLVISEGKEYMYIRDRRVHYVISISRSPVRRHTHTQVHTHMHIEQYSTAKHIPKLLYTRISTPVDPRLRVVGCTLRLNRIQAFPFHGVTRPLRFATFLSTLPTSH
jgi:hypothetical protein